VPCQRCAWQIDSPKGRNSRENLPLLCRTAQGQAETRDSFYQFPLECNPKAKMALQANFRVYCFKGLARFEGFKNKAKCETWFNTFRTDYSLSVYHQLSCGSTNFALTESIKCSLCAALTHSTLADGLRRAILAISFAVSAAKPAPRLFPGGH